ncbi:MAG TPA: beta galactosidase jelly roll domain-containing protein, partial [Bryobacteraceae bacterium]
MRQSLRRLASVYILFGFSFIAAAAAIPRSEYPEPQFMRSSWMSLNGEWDFAFDDQNQGLTQRWNASPLPNPRKIVVPYCFESRLSGIGDTSFHPVFWYRRGFSVPKTWTGKHVLLHFGAVDYRASVWLHGHFLGTHQGGGVPFSFDITETTEHGANKITVRVEDPPTDKSVPRGKQYWEPKSKSIFYTRTSGIWQPVWIEPTGSHHLDYVHVT